MSEPIWNKFLTERDKAVFGTSGYAARGGFGKRPALLIIDVQYRTIGTSPKPILEAIKEFPTSCGEIGWNAMRNIATLLAEFRRNQWPVLYPHVAPKNKATDGGRLAEKVPAIMEVAAKGYEFPAEIAPREGDVLIPKKHPSAFFATPLASHLIDLAADTLVVTGCTTSGCVRGSVLDAFAYNFRAFVPHDAVYDRCATSHAVNLFDMAAKYADVATTAEILERLRPLSRAQLKSASA
jgi:maleamate amidohydrolase